MEFKWNGDYLDEGDFRLFIDGQPSALIAIRSEDGSFELEEGMLDNGPELPENWGDAHAALVAEHEHVAADTYRDRPYDADTADGESPEDPYLEESEHTNEVAIPEDSEEEDDDDWLPSASHREKRAAAREAKIARRKQREELGEVIPLKKKVIGGSIAASLVVLLGTGGGFWFAMNQPQPAAASLAYPPAIVGYSVLPEDVANDVDTVRSLISDADDLLKESKNKVARGGQALRVELRETMNECEATVLDVRFPPEDEVERCIEVLREGAEAVQESHDRWLEAEERRQKEEEENRRQQQNNNNNNGGNNNNNNGGNNGNNNGGNNNNPPPTQSPPPTNTPPPTQQPGGSFTISCRTDHTLTVSATGGVSVAGRSGPSVTLSGNAGATYSGTYNGVVSMTATGVCSIS